jgi:hypothetical protein
LRPQKRCREDSLAGRADERGKCRFRTHIALIFTHIAFIVKAFTAAILINKRHRTKACPRGRPPHIKQFECYNPSAKFWVAKRITLAFCCTYGVFRDLRFGEIW